MVREHLLDRFSEADLLSQSFRVYTTLDPELQRAASEAVDAGAKNVDAQLAKRYAKPRWRSANGPSISSLVHLAPYNDAERTESH